MAMTRAELGRMLAALDTVMPAIIREHQDEGDFWSAFAGEADCIQDEAGDEDYDWVSEQLDEILSRHGKPVSCDVAPSDDLPLA
jgi:hypothetical protein